MKGRPTVWVVDDNKATRTLIEHALELEGYEVLPLPNGTSVMAKIESEIPDLVILDVMMPAVDGFTVLKKIRGDERTRHLPVLMLTALDDSESTWKGWSGGCDYYMNKPFDVEALLSVVSNLTTGVRA